MIKVIAFDFIGVLVNEKDIELSIVEDEIEREFGDNSNIYINYFIIWNEDNYDLYNIFKFIYIGD